MRFPISPEAVAAGETKLLPNVNDEHDRTLTFGDRLADSVARWGGSWNFIVVAGIVLVLWTAANAFMLGAGAFDPYPFVFLNLILSMIAALQAPIIMMSQNRQSVKDRISAQLDYEINCKAEAEILRLHEKFDARIEALHARTEEGLSRIERMLEVLSAAGGLLPPEAGVLPAP